MPTLTIQLPGRPPVEHALREEVITLGRTMGNTIALEDSSVSQSHAKITRIGSDYSLTDLDSTNGTVLNGQSITEARLRSGDVLKLGAVVAIFETGPVGAPVPAPVIPPTNPAPVPTTKQAKSATTALPAKAKTTLLKPVSPGASGVPPAPPLKTKSLIILAASIIGGVAVAVVVGVWAWQLAGGTTTKPIVLTRPTTPLQPTPQTNIITQTTEPPLGAEPPMKPETATVAEATNAPVQQATNNLPGLLAALRSPEVSERRHAAETISALESGATSAVLNLRVALLQESDPAVRLWLVVGLVNNQTYDQSTIPVLVESLKQEGATLRQQACNTLALIPYDAASKTIAVAALNAATEDDNAAVRQAALAALKVIAPEEATAK